MCLAREEGKILADRLAFTEEAGLRLHFPIPFSQGNQYSVSIHLVVH
jgi:hypothetical protein